MKVLIPIAVAVFFIAGIWAMANVMCAAFPTLYPQGVCND